MQHYDLEVPGARERWTEIRWALFVFPAIRDVQPAGDPDVVRVFHESEQPYPRVWGVELAQQGLNISVPSCQIEGEQWKT